jgi:hypothetical protein
MLDAVRRRKDISNASYYDGVSDICNTLMVEGADAFVQKFGMHEAERIPFERYSRLRATNPVCIVEIRS